MARPWTDDLTGYTTLVTTEKIVDQLVKLQLRTDEQFNGLQGRLNTLEWLCLCQLDQGAEMVSSKCEVKNSLIQYFQVNVLQQLQAVLSSQQAEDRARPPQAVKIGPLGKSSKACQGECGRHLGLLTVHPNQDL